MNGLKKINLLKYFNEKSIYSFDLVGKPKPCPEIFIKAVEDMKIDKNETIIIEDSVIGVQAGVSADIKVIGLTAGSHWHKERSHKELFDAGAYDVVNNYKDMLLLVDKL